MGKKRQYTRLMLLALLLGMGFAGLAYRLVDLQVLRHDELRVKARHNAQHEVLLEPRRGDILDAKGNLLATSVFVKTVCADASLMGSHQAEIAHAVAPLLQLNENELRERITPRVRPGSTCEMATNRYVVLKRKVPAETWQKVQAAMTNLTLAPNEKQLSKQEKAFNRDLRQKSAFVEPLDDQLRVYPNQALAAHVLGFVGMEEGAVNGSRVLETSGKDGVERALNSKLAGVRGWRVMETDHARREIVALRGQDVEPRDSLNVVLTIDSVIQNIVESALAEGMETHSPISITGIAMRPRTGEILAMATLPNFDPNNPGASPADARRNRVIADIAEPGSTFKIVVVSGALNDGTVGLSDTFDCEHGHFHFAGRVLHDAESHGVLSVEQIITESSNIGAAKIGIKMGQARLYDYIRSFGFAHGDSLAGGSGRHRASAQGLVQGFHCTDSYGPRNLRHPPADDDGDVRYCEQGSYDGADAGGSPGGSRPQRGGEVLSPTLAPGNQRTYGQAYGPSPQDGGFTRWYRSQSRTGTLQRCGKDRHSTKV